MASYTFSVSGTTMSSSSSMSGSSVAISGTLNDDASHSQMQSITFQLGLSFTSAVIPLLPANAVIFTYTPGANGTDQANVQNVSNVFKNGNQV